MRFLSTKTDEKPIILELFKRTGRCNCLIAQRMFSLCSTECPLFATNNSAYFQKVHSVLYADGFHNLNSR